MITRDGASISLWQNTTAYEVKNPAPLGGEFEIGIVGAGITGLTLALMLQKLGKNAPTTAHINSFVDMPFSDIGKNFGQENAQFVANAILGALGLIKENVSEHHIDCDFEEKEAFLFAESDDEVSDLESINEGMVDVGLQPKYVSSIPVPFSFKKALKIGGQAKFHPVKYCFGLARAFEEAGGIVYENCRVRNDDENEKITLVTDLGRFECDHLIYATHIPPGLNLLNLRCAPYRTYAMALTLANAFFYKLILQRSF